MKLKKAIEILSDLLGDGPHFPPDDRREAVKLGIEALKRIRDIRLSDYIQGGTDLPGETKEKEVK